MKKKKFLVTNFPKDQNCPNRNGRLYESKGVPDTEKIQLQLEDIDILKEPGSISIEQAKEIQDEIVYIGAVMDGIIEDGDLEVEHF